MKKIPLSNGKVAFVSDEDWPVISHLRWRDKGGGYVQARYKKSAGGSGEFVYLHRFIMSPPPGYVVDHIDGNPLNNTRENLQVTTYSRNSMRFGHARMPGMSFDRQKNMWRVRLKMDGRLFDFGLFNTKEEAAKTVRIARQAMWSPEFNSLGTKP